MKNSRHKSIVRAVLAGLACAVTSANVCAQLTVTDNFTGATNSLNWQVLGSACLTAGTSSSSTSGQIVACSPSGDGGQKGGYGDTSHANGYLAAGVNDPVGNGALRLTNATGSDHGAVIYNDTFPSTLGIAITFTAVSYDGDSGGTVKDGADGLSFFLLNGSVTPSIGAVGGSLGYSCSDDNNPYDGQTGAYIGLGIDEFGNFLNPGDNTATGVDCVSSVSACSTSSTIASGSGPYYQGNRIGLRGAGNINWAQLTANYPTYYPSTGSHALSSSQQQTAVQKTCSTGTLWNYSSSASNPTQVTSGGNPVTIPDYAPLAGSSLALPTSSLIATEQGGSGPRNTAISRTYNLKITSTGLLTLSYAIDSNGVPGNSIPVLTNSPIFASNGTLPSTFKFGFSAGTGGSNNIHEITCFQAAPADDSDSSAAVNVVQTGEVKTGTQVYLAYYHTTDWWGQLTSQNLSFSTTLNTLVISSTANWDGACVLTGDTSGAATSTLTGGTTTGACPSTGSTSDSPESPTSSGRQILTYNPLASTPAGIALEYANLNTTQIGWLNGDGNGSTRLSYLRGDRTNETSYNATTQTTTGLYRARISVLGDIVDSSPTWVGAPIDPYPGSAGNSVTTWVDMLNPTTTMAENTVSYGTFQSNNATRLNVVYAGANDGMMHGFEAGSYDSTGTVFSSTHNDGKEVIAYMPNAVLSTIHNATNTSLDYSSPNYSRNYYVDATPATGDVYYGGAWHTLLVGGLGAGGNAIYALDITNPSAYSESSPGIVLGEWDTSTSSLGANLGQTYGTPQLRRFHSGNWGIIFGNGYNSANGVAGVFVALLDKTTGAPTFYFLSTGTGSTTSPNGIFTPESADLDGDHVIDYIYAGDLQGNVWRWDVTSSTPSTWQASTSRKQIFSAPTTTYTTTVGTTTTTTKVYQPISTQVQVLSVPNPGGLQRLVVDFGTGYQLQSPTTTTYAPGTQAVYGIWDGNFTTWNANTNVAVANQFDVYPAAQTAMVASSQLQKQTVTTTSSITNNGALQNYRVMSSNTVCWADLTTTCPSGSTSGTYGWTYSFGSVTAPAVGEQVVFNPQVVNGVFFANTYIPATLLACTVSAPTGWTMALNPATGGAFPQSVFVNSSSVNESQIQTNASGSGAIVNANNTSYLINQTLNNGATVSGINFQGGTSLRLNWTELR